jgi:hypothetical protein
VTRANPAHLGFDLRNGLCLPGPCQLRAEQVDLLADAPGDTVS